MTDERYTAVIPAYNAAVTVEQAVRSVLEQSIPPEVVVVVDDGSTDDTARIVSGLGEPVTLVQQDNRGPGAATSRGFAAATTGFIATLDADDLWLPGKIETQLRAFRSDPGLAAVFGRIAIFYADPLEARFESAYDGWSRTTMLVRRTVAAATGAIVDAPGRVGEMVDWLARMRENGSRLAMLPDVVSLRRIREGSLTFGRRSLLAPSYIQIARAAISRRRSPGNEESS